MKLNASNLGNVAASIVTPGYARSAAGHTIVHIGVGGFFRAHQAVYLDDLLQLAAQPAWHYCGVGLLPQDSAMRDAMQAQDCLYTVVERSAAGDVARVIGAMSEFLFAPDDPQAVLERLAHPDTRIVSLTITEGGYYINHGTGKFDPSHADIVHDLAHPQAPHFAFGYLAEALERRRQRGLPPFVVMSCDNLENNGEVTRMALLGFAQLRDPTLHAWLERECHFPNSMVDRITPATTDVHRAMVATQFGLDDAWPVVAEPFRQWVIEDQFAHGRPDWERVGAQMTDDVRPYEKMKLRLLNASHQALCYSGMLLGYQYAHEAMTDERIRTLVRAMMQTEVIPLLATPAGIDLQQYCDTVIERFSNPALNDQLARIGTEGSARIPKFVLPSIVEALQAGGPITLLCLTVACWLRYLTGIDEAGRPMPINDPHAARLQALALRVGANPQDLLAQHDLFGDLGQNQAFFALLQAQLGSLYRDGVEHTLVRMAAASTP
jgi:mannitol 2-dehydrogenase